MKKVLTVLVLLIIIFTGKGIQFLQGKALNQLERQAVLDSFNREIEQQTNAFTIVQETVSSVRDIQISPTPETVNIEEIRELPEPTPEPTPTPTPEIPKNNTQGVNEKEKPVYGAIGRIRIDKINIDYPILGTTTKETLDISVTLLYGKGINKLGNVILAGHNKKDGSLFGRLKELNQGDIIELQDKSGKTLKYKVYKIYVVEPTDLEPLSQDVDGKRIVTLLTCTNKGKQRLILKAEYFS